MTFSKIIKGKVGEDNCNLYYDLNLKNKMFIHDFKYLLGQSSVNISTNNKYSGILGLYHKLERDILVFFKAKEKLIHIHGEYFILIKKKS